MLTGSQENQIWILIQSLSFNLQPLSVLFIFLFFSTPLLMRTVYPCSIAASELVSDITVRIGTTKFYLHKVSGMLFSFIWHCCFVRLYSTKYMCCWRSCFFMWFGFIFSYQSCLCADDSWWPLINLFLSYMSFDCYFLGFYIQGT
jgi:hypothetical protein